MRDAATLLRDHPPPDLPQEEAEHLIDAIEAPYGARIVRTFRDALRASEDPRAQTEHVVAKAKELGLEPSPPPEPLPVIEMDVVHLVCWLAIVSGAAPT